MLSFLAISIKHEIYDSKIAHNTMLDWRVSDCLCVSMYREWYHHTTLHLLTPSSWTFLSLCSNVAQTHASAYRYREVFPFHPHISTAKINGLQIDASSKEDKLKIHSSSLDWLCTELDSEPSKLTLPSCTRQPTSRDVALVELLVVCCLFWTVRFSQFPSAKLEATAVG